MPGQLVNWSRQERATWWRSLLTLFLVIVAFFLVPFAHWWAVPLLVWSYVRAMPRWVPVWFQWGLVVFLSGHLAGVSGWSLGASLALLATTVAAVYWERAAQQLVFQVLQEVVIAGVWIMVALWSGNTLWWEANVIILLAVISGQIYRQGK